jgi:catechol 2,3-dioxygenase-like lactoylglutathione lyase family enzyme
MNIIGPDSLVFGVDDVDACTKYFTDYGLTPAGDGRFEALNGTSVVIRPRDDASLPAALETGSMLRKTIYGVADKATLTAIAAELGKDRDVKTLGDGSLETVDDLGFALGFQVTVRKALDLSGEVINAPGVDSHRPVNVIGADPDAVPKPRSLSHVVYFVPDLEKFEAFYAERLGFVTTDRFTGVGPFMRPAGTQEHHTLFCIQTPPFMQGCEHFTFHVGGPTELMQAGKRFSDKGYETFWGPGRHIYGSNWFWYFNSPVGCHVEYDADMDLHDDDWVAREASMGADTSQIFLFTLRDNWAPSGPPPPKAD